MPENADWKSLFFNGGGRKITRTYVFDANAISTLKLIAKSKSLEQSSRVLAVSAFEWKHAMQASRSVSGTLKATILFQPVNLRPKFKPALPSYSIGNMFSMASSMYNPVGKYIDLSELSYLVREATKSAPNDPQTLFSIPGIHNREFSNGFVLKEARQHNAIEVWITLSDKEMGFLERDPEFLAFASPSSYFDKSEI
ncbi:vinorine synthase-like [Hibiscus syriacus]|uniref:vinorine synthase-like n=1 Tax=Hibiscus syriacus TaxID=106335 RepID=UPI001920A26F|nr:vinorine synthase-like [Hibiscus syriacus]